MHDDELLTVAEVMARLRLGRSTVYDLLRTGQLASVTIGRCRRIPVIALRDFIAGQMESAA
ncbi:helix-turn-helix domain-containing protein [Streptomyces sp. Wb2n-11]|uniref:helix-turn-helix domain-containing protein n=1 Tax=Streptomyces sp. Wb2n-11 TaxID=1030533 RepID=UPI000B26007D|nr:helix-turn-helix domain-containing protein [Streptomyces sp. Wb2n-11]